jgi:type I restriction enzyme S subunit
MATLKERFDSELARVKVSIVADVRTLADRYATPLSTLEEDVARLHAKVMRHLATIGVEQGTVQALLTGKTRLPGFEGEWVERRLGECATIARGGSPRPIEAYLTTDVNGLNWVKIGDVKVDAKYIESTKERIIPKGLAYTRAVLPGDLILSNSMSFGRPYIMRISGCIHDGWLVIQNYHKYFDAEFLYYSLGSEYVQRQYETLAAGSSVLNLNKDIVSKIVVFAPLSIAEQRAIASVLSDMDAAIAALAREKSKAEQIKQGMMQELLTGKIRLKGE